MAFGPNSSDTSDPIDAPRWIWAADHSKGETNSRFQFTRNFQVNDPHGVWLLQIAADSRYRLWLNGGWISDGPARSYPDGQFFDEIDVSKIIRSGSNTVVAEITHFGVDTFQYIRGEAGFWFTLGTESQPPQIVSDHNWISHRVHSHLINTPRIGVQFGFEEHVDHGLPPTSTHPVIFSARTQAPRLRDTSLLGQKTLPLHRLIRRSKVQPIQQFWTIHAREHLGPFPGGVNVHGMAGVIGTELHASRDDSLELLMLGCIRGVYLDGILLEKKVDQDLHTFSLNLSAGKHWLSVAISDRYDHISELSIGYRDGKNTICSSPFPSAKSPWVSSGPMWTAQHDTNCPIRMDGSIDESLDTFVREGPEVGKAVDRLASCKTAQDFIDTSTKPVETIAPIYQTRSDAYFSIRSDSESETIASPSSLTDMELRPFERVIFDLEDISNGYFQMDIEAEDSFTIDGYFFESLGDAIDRSCIQFMQNDGNSYRNSFRFSSGRGKNPFFSTQRRGFRYAMLTLRGSRKAVRIQQLRVIESIHPLPLQAFFKCSDPALEEIFRISQRTLHLCMEDTFTDCPSYEQVFWVGDTRNEALFAAVTFGAYDLIERCSRLVADSLRELPMAACQCPSGWNVILPSFSFLWVISAWENYQQTGNLEFLREIFPAIRKTTETGVRLCTNQGLFSAPTWNFFEWAPIDQGQRTVLHNSMLLARALEVASKIAGLLGENDLGRKFGADRDKLIQSIQGLWSDDSKTFADAVLDSGGLSKKESQHTSFLALLFDLISDPQQRQAALENCSHPKPGLTTVGSPFAMFFLLDVLMREGHGDQVLEKIRNYWGRMLAAKSPTCWEMIYPATAPFPTRSYCHGWSAAPVYLFPFLFFGIEIMEAGWKKVRLRPQNLGLEFIEASVCTPLGLLVLRQRLEPDGKLRLEFDAPDGMQVSSET